MTHQLTPEVGHWYQHHDKGDLFEVIATDADGTIDIQDFDGAVEELDLDTWREMDIAAAEAPEDWTGPFDDIEPDDPDYSEAGMATRGRRSLELLSEEESWEDVPLEGRQTLAG